MTQPKFTELPQARQRASVLNDALKLARSAPGKPVLVKEYASSGSARVTVARLNRDHGDITAHARGASVYVIARGSAASENSDTGQPEVPKADEAHR